jgi:hypothetical protein
MSHVPARLTQFALPALLLLSFSSTGRAEEPVRLEEAFPTGYQYHVSTRVQLTGTLTVPAEKDKPAPKPLDVIGESAIEYDERVLSVTTAGAVERTARIYRKLELQRKVGQRKQESTLRPEVRRLVLLRQKTTAVPFSPDGPLTWAEIDLVRTDVFTPALVGLLPDKAVSPGDKWPAAAGALQELTALEAIDEGSVECRLDQVSKVDGRRMARVNLAGSVKGTNEDGPNKQILDGYLFFDLESRHLSYLYLKGTHLMLDKDGKEVGRVEGYFILTRQANQKAKDLTDEALKGVAVEPDDSNTRLLYDNPDLGVRLLYPRRWKVAAVQGWQVTLDAPDGSGLTLTLEPSARVPSGADFLKESQTYLQDKHKAKILNVQQPRKVQAAPQEVEQFGLEVEVEKQRVQMDYYVFRQAKGGGTIASRLQPMDLDALRKEVEGIARSVMVTKDVK